MLTGELSEKNILVTGCCGTIGMELIRQLVEVHGVRWVTGIDNDESGLFNMEQRYAAVGGAHFVLGDVRDLTKLRRRMRGADIVFHVAAFKHVTLCERSPYEAVQTNILGVQNVIQAALDNQVEKVIFTSSDKAVNPTSVMGTSKLMGERLMTAANSNQRTEGPIFTSTRFGNVLGSSGSVVSVFREQIRAGGPVTLTNEAMTRFVMSISQAVSLVIDSCKHARGGEVLITKMPVMRIRGLATVMIENLAPVFGHDPADIELEVIGVKPGEKMYEELLSGEETRRALELRDYFAILPAFRNIYDDIDYSYDGVISERVSSPYTSDHGVKLNDDEIRELLESGGLLSVSDGHLDPTGHLQG